MNNHLLEDVVDGSLGSLCQSKRYETDSFKADSLGENLRLGARSLSAQESLRINKKLLKIRSSVSHFPPLPPR